jgi:hypothetical protein
MISGSAAEKKERAAGQDFRWKRCVPKTSSVPKYYQYYYYYQYYQTKGIQMKKAAQKSGSLYKAFDCFNVVVHGNNGRLACKG